jgi:hypothetical protein
MVTSKCSWLDFDGAIIHIAATPKMEIPWIYGFHFMDGIGRVTRVLRDKNIQAVER